MQTDDPERAGCVIALALEQIPVVEIATGPACEYAIGARFRHHRNLGSVVEQLGRFPGKGLALIHPALQSPVSSNRSEALDALAAWGEAHWGVETRRLLEAAWKIEPLAHVRERMGELLAGGSAV